MCRTLLTDVERSLMQESQGNDELKNNSSNNNHHHQMAIMGDLGVFSVRRGIEYIQLCVFKERYPDDLTLEDAGYNLSFWPRN